MVTGTLAVFGIAGISFWLGIQLERSRQEKEKKRYYIRRCRLASKEVKHGFFSKTEPNI